MGGSSIVVVAVVAISFCCLASVSAQCKGKRYLDPIPAPKVTDVLFPLPSSVTHGTSTYPLAPAFTINTASSSDILKAAVARYTTIIRTLSLAASGALDVKKAYPINSLTISVASPDESLQYGVDETYVLSVDSPTSLLSAHTVYGALKGLETFSQLVLQYDDALVVPGSPWMIRDQPRYGHRGVLIDTSRHFLSVASIQRAIDGAAYSKMNVLHWHLTDAQSFPFNVDAFPNLVNGAFSSKEIYSASDFKSLVAYATQRGVRIVIEIDAPGHTSSWGVGYPEVTVCRDKTRQQGYCAENPCGELDPSNPATFQIIDAIVLQLTQIFPDKFFHFGSDEVVYNCWNTPQINAWMKQQGISSYVQVLGYFTNRTHQIAQKYNLVPVNWEEVFNEGLYMGSNSIVNVWQSFGVLQKVVKAGHRAILGNYDAWYLDCGFGTWCPYCTWLDAWANDPLTNASLTPEQQALILGGEASLWSEMVTDRNFDSRLWPRAAAAGERLWSPQNVTNVGDAFTRIIKHNCRLALRGLDSEALIPGSTSAICDVIQE